VSLFIVMAGTAVVMGAVQGSAATAIGAPPPGVFGFHWDAYSVMVTLHIWVAVFAMISGGWMIYGRKGTPVHRYMGFGFVLAMIVVNVTVLIELAFTGKILVFHALTILSGWTLYRGLAPMIRSRLGAALSPGDIVRHGHYMIWTYYGLLAAFTAQVIMHSGDGDDSIVVHVAILIGLLWALSRPTRALARRLTAPWQADSSANPEMWTL